MMYPFEVFNLWAEGGLVENGRKEAKEMYSIVERHRSRWRASALAIVLVLLVAVVSSGCSVTAAPSDAELPALEITAREYSFSGAGTVAAGPVAVTLNNEGELAHHAQFALVRDGFTRDEVLGLFQSDANAALGALVFVGGPGLVDPGGSQQVFLTLTPGEYLVLSFVPDSEGIPYMAKGMVHLLDVTPADGAEVRETSIGADGLVKLHDYTFILPDEVESGSQIWEVRNQGEQIHEIMLLRPRDGMSSADVLAYLQSPHGPEPYTNVGGFQAIHPEKSGLMKVELEPGEYVATCYIPTQEPGQTHVHMGMVQAFTVR